MTDGNAPASRITPTDVDYDQLYRGEEVFPGVVVKRPPWDIGRPQTLLVEFERAGRITGEVLDIGCGPGDTAVYLAGLGYQVTGLDVAPTAIEQARARASEQGVSARFEVADAVSLDRFEGRFDTVVSSALLHCLDPEQRRTHVDALARAITPGGRLIQFCFIETDHAQSYAPFPISEMELRATFVPPIWSITELRVDRLEVAKPNDHIFRLFAQADFDPDFNDKGEMLLPVLVLEAQRI
jgi:SAM-dependent methyltransferase